MPQEFKPGCARPTGGIVEDKEKEKATQDEQLVKKEEKTMTLIGRKAPDFTAPHIIRGNSSIYNYQNILENGFFYVSIQAISPSFEQLSFQQLLKSILNLRNLALKFFR